MFGGNQRRARDSPWDGSDSSGRSAGQSASHPHPQPQSSSSQMIPNAPTFYDQEDIPTDPDSLDYQHYQNWLQDHAVSQGSQYHFMRQNIESPFQHSYRPQGDLHDPTVRHHVQHTPAIQVQAPLQNQYTFVPGQYQPPAPAQSQYVSDSSHAPPQTYHQQEQPVQAVPNTDPYFFSSETIPSQQAVQQSSRPGSSYQHTEQSYSQPSFTFRASASDPHLAPPGSSSSSSEYPGYVPAFHSKSVSPMSDILGSGASPPPLPATGAGSGATPLTARLPGQMVQQGRKGKKSRGTKRRRLSEESASDSDDDYQASLNAQMNVHVAPGPDHNFPTRLPGACTHCKKLKMKCDFPKNQNDNVCKRCKAGGHQCRVEGRKPRSQPNKREYLLLQIRQKDAVIENLLKQLHNPYHSTPLSIAAYRTSTSPSDQHNQNVMAWLDRMTSSHKSSVKAAGGTVGEQAFKIESRGKPRNEDSDSDSDPDGATTVRAGDKAGNDEGEDADTGINGGAGGGRSSENDEVDNTSALPDATVPLGLIANLSLSNTSGKSRSRKDDDDDNDVGVANEGYFKPGPATDLVIRASMIEQHTPPEILVHGVVTPEDVDKLFAIFYDHLNPHMTLLDPVLHTPSTTFTRCPFLFTVVCAVSSRYYTDKSEIYPIAMHFARHSAATALNDGWKSVELCQAYILLSTYGVPAKRWEEDRSWLYLGLAIRIATDLNLHSAQHPTKKPMSARQEREALNKMRVWLICFNLDRSTSTQFGKPPTIRDNYVTRNSADWYKKSEYNYAFDIGLCAYTNLLRIVAKFHEDLFSDPNSPTGLNKSIDFRTITQAHDENLIMFHNEWEQRFANGSNRDSGYVFRSSLLPYLVNYSRLVMYSFGFQYAFESGIQPNDIFFPKCFEAAKSVVQIMIESLGPSGFMRYSPDGHFVFASFASAFLLKLLRPEFSSLLKPEDETRIFDLIGRLILTLASPDVAIDDRHTPKLHARFLSALLTKHQRDYVASGRSQPQNPPPSQTVRHGPYGPVNPSGSSSQVFSVAPPQTSSSSSSLSREARNTGQSFKSSAASPTHSEDVVDEAPAYQGASGTYLNNNGFREGDNLITPSFSNMTGEDITPATLQALRNPTWWTNMMMPGFSWPVNDVILSSIGSYHGLDDYQHQNHRQMPNGMGEFEIFQMAQMNQAPLTY